MYLPKMNQRVVDDLVVNMVDVGEETGELDTMLYKVADTYDEEVAVLTESLVSLMEPLLIIFLGGMVGFIVIALFMPLVKLITDLSGGAAAKRNHSTEKTLTDKGRNYVHHTPRDPTLIA